MKYKYLSATEAVNSSSARPEIQSVENTYERSLLDYLDEIYRETTFKYKRDDAWKDNR